MKKTILASAVSLIALSAFTSTQVMAEEYYFRYPVSASSGGSGGGEGGSQTGGGLQNNGDSDKELTQCEKDNGVWFCFAEEHKLNHEFGFDNTLKKTNDSKYDLSKLPTVEYPSTTPYDILLENSNISNIYGFRNIKEVVGTLNLSGNKITSLDSLSGLSKSGNINLSNNNISSISGLKSLISVNEGLNLSNNDIVSLDGLENLYEVGFELNLKNNKITSLDGDLNNLSRADFIEIDRTVNEINNSFNSLTGTDGLSLNGSVHNSFKDLKSIYTLSLYGPGDIKDSFNNLTNVEYLSINNSNIVNSFNSLTKVKNISIHSSNIDVIGGSVNEISIGSILDLSSNDLRNITGFKGGIRASGSSLEVNLSGNSNLENINFIAYKKGIPNSNNITNIDYKYDNESLKNLSIKLPYNYSGKKLELSHPFCVNNVFEGVSNDKICE